MNTWYIFKDVSMLWSIKTVWLEPLNPQDFPITKRKNSCFTKTDRGRHGLRDWNARSNRYHIYAVFEPEEVATLITYMGMGRPTAYIAYQHLVMIQRELSGQPVRSRRTRRWSYEKRCRAFLWPMDLLTNTVVAIFLMEEPYEESEDVTTIELSWYDVAIFVMVLVLASLLVIGMVKWDSKEPRRAYPEKPLMCSTWTPSIVHGRRSNPLRCWVLISLTNQRSSWIFYWKGLKSLLMNYPMF